MKFKYHIPKALAIKWSVLALKKSCILIWPTLFLLLVAFHGDPDFPVVKGVKSITEWRQSADSNGQPILPKWLKSKRIYYPNGLIRQELHVEYNGDTTFLSE
jgi:hypothetical protein